MNIIKDYMARKSTTQYAREELKRLGYEVQTLESVVPYTFIKRDVFGFDLLGVNRDGHIIFVQVTTLPNISARIKKINNIEASRWLLSAKETSCEVWGVRLGRLKGDICRIKRVRLVS